MKQNHKAFAPEAATDEPASPINPAPVFATGAERAAYERGLADARATGADDQPPSAFDFDPVEARYRHDGITPAKQREYVEALADTGIARTAAARIGVTEQSVSRFRRRADAASFDLACEAARRFGARRIRDTAWERAVEGTVKGHYYHGELKSEERVYDNRLLIYLLGKTGHLLGEPKGARAVAANWEPFVEAIGQGAPPPDLEREAADCDAVRQDMNGQWWTRFPPPEDFDGVEEGQPGGYGYQRWLTEAEQAVVDADLAQERAETIADQTRRRDLYFGFAGGRADGEDFSLMGHEPYEPSVPDDFAPPSDAAIDGIVTDDPVQRAARPAARILLLDPDERILLFRFDAGDRPPFWGTPGGALDPGEDFATCARRELLEETGLDLDCGPQVARRVVEFVTLENVPVVADERYFLVRTDTADIATSGHTELERRVMRDWRWFTRAELEAHDEAIFPENLPLMLDLAAGVRIRPFRPADAPALARLFHDAVHNIASHHYTPAQVAAWAPAVPDPARFLARGADGRTLLVAEGADGALFAYGDVEADGHIDHLFCRPEAAGAGIAARLYAALEEAARDRGIARLHTEASEPARRFFERRGFAVLHRRDFTLAEVPIHNYAMEKQLAPSGPDRMTP